MEKDISDKENKFDVVDKKISEYEKVNLLEDKNINITIIFCLVIILSFIGGFLGSYFIVGNNSNYVSSDSGVVISSANLDEVNSISGAVSNIYDAVVVVEVYKDNKLISTGTGFVYKIDKDKCYLMTNNHVISSGDSIKVLFTNGEKVDALLVGGDVYSDIAILSVEGNSEIVTAVIGNNDDVMIGDTVFAVGSPEGSDYAGTVTKGIISGKNRIVEVSLANNSSSDYYMEVLQTDAAINPGNSGGPICNIKGEVIGITNMKLVSDTIEGMGFAIPIEDAIKVAEILESEGEYIRPYIGVEMLDIRDEFSLWRAGILIPEGIKNGVVIYNVLEDSPADEAGLLKGDIIIKIDDYDIDNFADFRYILYKYNPGEQVDFVYIRDGVEEKASIELGRGE